MTHAIRFQSDTDDPSLPKGYARNAFGQVVRVEFCCSAFAQGFDCGCAENG